MIHLPPSKAGSPQLGKGPSGRQGGQADGDWPGLLRGQRVHLPDGSGASPCIFTSENWHIGGGAFDTNIHAGFYA